MEPKDLWFITVQQGDTEIRLITNRFIADVSAVPGGLYAPEVCGKVLEVACALERNVRLPFAPYVQVTVFSSPSGTRMPVCTMTGLLQTDHYEDAYGKRIAEADPNVVLFRANDPI